LAHIDTSDIIRGAVWIRPTDDALDKIQKVMRSLHKRGGGPQFQPHVTLLEGMETTQASAEVKLKKLALRLKPFTVRLGRIDWRREYFRCLFATAELSAELAAAQRDAYDVFEMKPAPPFEPHLSLLYGNIDEALQQELAAQAGGSLDVSFEVSAVHLVDATDDVPVTKWRTLSEHALG
jgi:2'-5' RNA ligase